jgi:hypothetical protein
MILASISCLPLTHDYSLNALRGCVTNGFDWKFFVFVQNVKENKGELLLLDRTISYTDLPLLIGVLYDWVG